VSLAVVAAHWPALSANAVLFDDNQFVGENPLVQNPSWESTRRFLTEVLNPSTVKGYYLPLAMISLMLDWALGGRLDDQFVFHRTSLLLHVLNTALVILILHGAFKHVLPAALVGLLFGLHPLTVEPVAWLGERKTVLAAFFALLAVLFHVRYAASRWWPWLGGSLFAYVLALLSKPTALALPAVLLLMDWWPLGRMRARALLEKIPHGMVGLAFLGITLSSHFRTAEFMSERVASAGHALVLGPYLICFYLSKLIWPVGLTPLYGLPEPMALGNSTVLVGVLVTALVAALGVYALRWTRAALVGGLVFLLLIFPTLGAVRYSWIIASDKYAYLPLIGAGLIAGWCLNRVLVPGEARQQSGRRVAVTVAIVLMLGIGEAIATFRQASRWRDTETLARHMVAVNPRGRQAHDRLATELVLQGRIDEAMRHFQIATELDPEGFETVTNLGVTLLRQGHYQEAIAQSEKALRLRPDLYKARITIATALFQLGRFEEAVAEFQEVLRYKPEHAESEFNLATSLYRLGRTREALAHYRKAIALQPDNWQAHHYAGHQHCLLGEFEAGIRCYDEVLRLRPDYAEAQRFRAKALRELSRPAQAADAYRAALRIDAADVLASFGLAECLEQMGDRNGAIAQYQHTLRIDPRHAGALARLHALRSGPGEAGEAP
jgi:tetratricopeptide (TPR) repeat protein